LACITIKNRLPVPLPLEPGLTELSISECMRTERADLVGGIRPGRCPQSEEGRICQVFGPFRSSTNCDKLSEKILRKSRRFRWCPSIAWLNGLGRVVSHLLLKPVAKVRGHPRAQPLLPSPHMVRQTCGQSWG